MTTKAGGSNWMGWALLGGLPASVAAVAIGGPLGIAVVAATAGAFAHGLREETRAKEVSDDDFARDAAQRRSLSETRKAQRRQETWDAEMESLWALFDEGDITDDDFDTAMNDLMDRCDPGWPSTPL